MEEETCPWKKFTHEELERQYSPSSWSSRFGGDEVIPKHVEEATKRTEEARKQVGARVDVRYCPLPRGLLDVYGEDLDGASPIFVYVHGGYWQELNKDVSGCVVPQLYQAGVVVVVVGYDLAPQVGVADIVKEVKEAVTWTCDLAEKRGSKEVILGGWSAGAQLITQVISEVRSGEGEVIKRRDLIKGFVTFGGVFDLRPLVTTYVNDALKLTSEEAWSLSPMKNVKKMARGGGAGGLKMLILIEEENSPEFIRQSKEYYEACVGEGLVGEYHLVEANDHFSIVCDLFLASHPATQLLIKFIKTCCE